MSTESEKAAAFLTRLLQNPALQPLNPLLKEEQILQFLQINARQLYPTLASNPFFPDRNWEQISTLLSQTLMQMIDGQFKQDLHRLVEKLIDFSFVQFLRQQNVPQEKIRDEVLSLIDRLLAKREVRRDLAGVYNALNYSYVDRYIEQAYKRHQYVHFELTKVQRLRMGKEEIKNYVRATLLLKPFIHVISMPEGGRNGETGSVIVQVQVIERVSSRLEQTLKTLPEDVIRSGMYANGSFMENRSMYATSRIAAVIAAMCRNVKPQQSIDRGADTADKSWLSIARRNYKVYGFDIKLLDELYKIAAENGW